MDDRFFSSSLFSVLILKAHPAVKSENVRTEGLAVDVESAFAKNIENCIQETTMNNTLEFIPKKWSGGDLE